MQKIFKFATSNSFLKLTQNFGQLFTNEKSVICRPDRTFHSILQNNLIACQNIKSINQFDKRNKSDKKGKGKKDKKEKKGKKDEKCADPKKKPQLDCKPKKKGKQDVIPYDNSPHPIDRKSRDWYKERKLVPKKKLRITCCVGCNCPGPDGLDPCQKLKKKKD